MKIDNYIAQLIEKWTNEISNSCIKSGALHKTTIDPLHVLFSDLLIPSAEAINLTKTRQASREIHEALDYLVDGAIVMGLEHRLRNPNLNIADENHVPEEIDKLLSRLGDSAFSIAQNLISISHSPGRLVLLPENTEQVRAETRKGLITAARRCFLAGYQSISSQSKSPSLTSSSIYQYPPETSSIQGGTNMEQKDHYMLAIFSFILGIFSLVAWFLPICGVPMSITGLIFGIVGKNSSRSGMATAGIVMNIIGLVLGIGNSAIGMYLGATGQLFQY